MTFHDQCFERHGHFAGDDLVRLTALLECANDPAYDVVWFAKGGYGSNRIAEAAVARMNLSARAKTYVGFSDCGYLLAALYRAWNRAERAWFDAGQRAFRRRARGDPAGAALAWRGYQRG